MSVQYLDFSGNKIRAVFHNNEDELKLVKWFFLFPGIKTEPKHQTDFFVPTYVQTDFPNFIGNPTFHSLLGLVLFKSKIQT